MAEKILSGLNDALAKRKKGGDKNPCAGGRKMPRVKKNYPAAS
jgi:hypothetical protein